MDQRFDIFADYCQILLRDVRAGLPDPALYDEEAMEDRLVTGLGALVFFTARNMSVPLVLALRNAAPALDLAAWDHVVEATLVVPSGEVTLHGPTDAMQDAPRIALAPGAWRVRYLAAGIRALQQDGLGGADHYRLELWPADPLPRRALKRALA